MRVLHQLGKGAQVARRLDPDGRQLDHLGPEIAQLLAQGAGLFARAGDDDAVAGQQPSAMPVELFA